MAYEQESLCKLHTVYNYPGRFGTKGRCFYKLENYIADLCIGEPHYFWTRRREKELWLAAQFARWDAATKPVSNPLRFFDEHGDACNCFVPTDGPCYIGFGPGTIPQPGIWLDRGTACQVDSKVYRNPMYDSMRGNSTNGSNQGNIDHLAQIDPALAQRKTTYEGALQQLLTANTSAPSAPYVPISLAQYKQQKETRFAIRSEEGRCKLAIESRVAQLAIDKGAKVSQDGTVHSEFLAQVRSQPKVWESVKHAQKSLPQDASKSIEAMFSGAGEKEDAFGSAEAMPVFAETSFEREATDPSSANVVTFASGAIREGADTGSSGTSQKGIPS